MQNFKNFVSRSLSLSKAAERDINNFSDQNNVIIQQHLNNSSVNSSFISNFYAAHSTNNQYETQQLNECIKNMDRNDLIDIIQYAMTKHKDVKSMITARMSEIASESTDLFVDDFEYRCKSLMDRFIDIDKQQENINMDEFIDAISDLIYEAKHISTGNKSISMQMLIFIAQCVNNSKQSIKSTEINKSLVLNMNILLKDKHVKQNISYYQSILDLNTIAKGEFDSTMQHFDF